MDHKRPLCRSGRSRPLWRYLRQEGCGPLGRVPQDGFTRTKKVRRGALRFLAHCPDVGIARSSRFVLHDLFVEELWFLFTRNSDAVARVRSEYEEVVSGIQYQATAAGPPAAPSTSVPSVIPLVKEDDGDADSLESF